MSIRIAFAIAVLVFATPAFAQQAPGTAPSALAATQAQTEFETRSIAFLLLLETMRGEMQAALTAAGSDQVKAEADLRTIGTRYQRRVNTFARETGFYSARMPVQWLQMRQMFPIDGPIVDAPIEIKHALMSAARRSGTFVQAASLPRQTRARSALSTAQPPPFVYRTPAQAQSAFEARSLAFQQAMETMRGELQAALTASVDRLGTEADMDAIVARYQPGATDFGSNMRMYAAMTPDQWAQMMRRFPIGGQISSLPRRIKMDVLADLNAAQAEAAFEARGQAFQQSLATLRGEMQAALAAAGTNELKATNDIDAIVARYEPQRIAFQGSRSEFSAMTPEQWARLVRSFPEMVQGPSATGLIKRDLIWEASLTGRFRPVLVPSPVTPVPVRPVAAQLPPPTTTTYVLCYAQTCQRYGQARGQPGFA